nr:capsid cement protein [Rodentibacter heylii]
MDNKATGTGIVGGVWRVKAKQADDIKQGAVLYWSDADGATLTAGGNKRLGIAWTDSDTASAEVDVKINA